jgi:hypothetical protein
MDAVGGDARTSGDRTGERPVGTEGGDRTWTDA